MMQRRNPAVRAGLLGVSTLLVPATARAASLAEAIDATFESPSLAFAAGVAGGVLATAFAATTFAVAHRASERAERRGGSGPAGDPPAPAYRPRHLREQAEPQDGQGGGGQEPHGPSHAASSYEQIAENYARRASFRARMARRAEGVAATLRERMGASMMEGVPVIERADGSVGDVGTSWWTRAVGADAIIRDSGFAEEGTVAIPSDFSATDEERLAAAARRAEGISRRVALVDEGAYPERRTVDDLDVRDDWEAALRSLDEKIAAEAPAQIPFLDSVGDADTLDEPDNLEPDTSFIPFKTPAGHPEVVDTDSYVDYLIEDEFSKNSSTAARRSSRRFLRVLEGGTQATSRHLADPSAPSRRGYVGRHFSGVEAAEA